MKSRPAKRAHRRFAAQPASTSRATQWSLSPWWSTIAPDNPSTEMRQGQRLAMSWMTFGALSAS
jgi:hypothetical protein